MYLHLISGFLGSGKTTAIQSACRVLLQRHSKVGVITNDQGIQLVDSKFFQALNIPNRQVVNGCFCCRYTDLETNVQALMNTVQPDVIFAESVGSCTDLIATLLKPLSQQHPNWHVTLTTFADVRLLHLLLKGRMNHFDASVRYIYEKQLEEAQLIVVNKTDCVETATLQEVKALLQDKFHNKTVLYQNSLDAESIIVWLHALECKTIVQRLPSLQIDYAVYGAGEAQLAWLDAELEITSTQNNTAAEAAALMHEVFKKLYEKDIPIGHLKFLLNHAIKISYTAASVPVIINSSKFKRAKTATVVINARVQTAPEILAALFTEAIANVKSYTDCMTSIKSSAAFTPGFPEPTHRFV